LIRRAAKPPLNSRRKGAHKLVAVLQRRQETRAFKLRGTASPLSTSLAGGNRGNECADTGPAYQRPVALLRRFSKEEAPHRRQADSGHVKAKTMYPTELISVKATIASALNKGGAHE
jgi:hypothetical protein